MTQDINWIAITFLAAPFVYLIYRYALLKIMQPYRMRLADLGVKLLNSPSLGEDEKNLVDSMLDDAFNWRAAPALILSVPGYMFMRATTADYEVSPAVKSLRDNESSDEFVDVYVKCIFGSNPIMSLVLLIVLLVPLIIALTVRVGVKRFINTFETDILTRAELRAQHC